MKNFKRHSIRLQEYDYSSAGPYYVTICIQNRFCLLGEISQADVELNGAGLMVYNQWLELPARFQNIKLDEFIVMPNHFHGIIVLNETAGASLVDAQPNDNKEAGIKPAPTLGDIIGAFKSITTNIYIKGVNGNKWESFPGKLWQRNYFERVIRDENEMNRIREYIRNNPIKWAYDENNPKKLEIN